MPRTAPTTTAPDASNAPRVGVASPPARQRGAALVLALVLLIATSALAISTLSGTRLSERLASNAQWKSTAFEVAESGIEAALADDARLLDALAAAAGDDAPPQAFEVPGLDLGEDYDRDLGTGSKLDHEGTLTVQFCGERPSRNGSDLNAEIGADNVTVSYFLDVRSTVTRGGAGTRAEHLQRVSLPGPPVAYGAACTAP